MNKANIILLTLSVSVLAVPLLSSCSGRNTDEYDETLPSDTGTVAYTEEITETVTVPEETTVITEEATEVTEQSEQTATSVTTEQLILTTAQSTEENVETEVFEREFIDISEFKDYDSDAIFHFGVTPVYKVNEDTYSIRYALMNTKGEIVSGFDYEQICGFSENGTAAFCEKGKWGFCDINGNILRDPVYTDVGIDMNDLCCTTFYDGFLAVSDLTDRWGFINKELEEVTEIKYTRPYDERVPRYVNKYALVRNDNYFFSFLDTKGREICPFKYTYAEDFSENGYAIVGTGEEGDIRYGIIDTDGREIVPCLYALVTDMSADGYAIAANYPENPQKPLSDYRIYSSDGTYEEISLNWRNAIEISSPPDRTEYEKALYRAGYMPYKRDRYFGVRDLRGNTVLESVYEAIYDIEHEKLPDGAAAVLERFGRRYTFMSDGDNIQYIDRRMDDTDPTQQVLLELAGFRPEYRISFRGGEKVLSAVYKDDVLYADLSELETPKACVSSDGYLYVVGYRENPDGGYSAVRKLISPDGEEIVIPEHCTLEYRYIWGGY